ncbi:hypothetical protein GGR52DRAFT_390318 [Hypoxylon sp. FL1284]|nr:hypothetical protein GGR52DRAFT_390318 [Hypoxylon sp. FL1284]
MSIIEVVFPQLKNDPETVKAVEDELPVVTKAFKDGGALKAAQGWLSTENGQDISSQHREIAILEWPAESNFHDFLQSEAFKSFQAVVKPLATGPPQMNLFQTNPAAPVFGAKTLGVMMLTPKDPDNVAALLDKIRAGLPKAEDFTKIVYGSSLNLPQKKVVVFRAFASKEEIQDPKNVASMRAIRSDLLGLAEITQFIADVKELPLHS